MQQLKDRLDALKEQKVFLSEQLKAIMKRNRVLQVLLVLFNTWRLYVILIVRGAGVNSGGDRICH